MIVLWFFYGLSTQYWIIRIILSIIYIHKHMNADTHSHTHSRTPTCIRTNRRSCVCVRVCVKVDSDINIGRWLFHTWTQYSSPFGVFWLDYLYMLATDAFWACIILTFTGFPSICYISNYSRGYFVEIILNQDAVLSLFYRFLYVTQ